MVSLLTENPFLLALVAAIFAETSAILLRRTSVVFGGWMRGISNALSLLSIFAFVWSFYWALQQGLSPIFMQKLAWLVLGWIGILVGVIMTGWGLIVLRTRAFFIWSGATLETRPPYRYLRRPMGLGVSLIGLGAGLIVGSPSMWIWYLTWLILVQFLYEFEEWELGTRLPGAMDYLKQTPRYLPWFAAIFKRK